MDFDWALAKQHKRHKVKQSLLLFHNPSTNRCKAHLNDGPRSGFVDSLRVGGKKKGKQLVCASQGWAGRNSSVEKWRDAERISLMENDISEISLRSQSAPVSRL